MKRIGLLLVVVFLLAFGVGRMVEAQSIGVGDARITLPIVVNLDPAGGGFSGMAAHFTIDNSGEITCLQGTEAGINRCDTMQTVRLAVDDINNIWGPGDTANIGSITVSGTPGETKSVWLTVIDSDDESGMDTTRNFAPVAIQVTIP